MKSKKKIVLIALLALAQLSYAQNIINFVERIIYPKDYSTVVPYENINGKLIIKVDVNGKSYRFIIDTGAAMTLIDKKILEVSNHSAFSVPVVDQSGKEELLPVIILNHIRIGHANFSEVPVITMDIDENPLFKCFNVDGILGNHLLAYSTVRISSTDKTITLTDGPSTLQLNKEHSSEFSVISGLPFIDVRFLNGDNAAVEPVLFDVGANLLYQLRLEHLPYFQEQNFVQPVKSTGSASIGAFGYSEEEVVFLVSIPKIEINGAVFNGILTETAGNRNSSIIGSYLLDFGIVTLDYINRLFYFEPFNKVNEVNKKIIPISPKISGNKLVVGIIWDASLENQISVGDQIVSIDDKDYTNFSICDLLLGAFKDKDSITFGIKNAHGDIKQITIERKDIL